jgi:hypothetical protein
MAKTQRKTRRKPKPKPLGARTPESVRRKSKSHMIIKRVFG